MRHMHYTERVCKGRRKRKRSKHNGKRGEYARKEKNVKRRGRETKKEKKKNMYDGKSKCVTASRLPDIKVVITDQQQNLERQLEPAITAPRTPEQ